MPATAALPEPPGPAPFRQMVWVPGGTFRMGSDHHYPEEAPAHEVAVDGFWIDRYAVTNDQFSRFVATTGHVTVAEVPPDPADYPGADPELVVPA
jgi:sulfatase modifying factor 1